MVVSKEARRRKRGHKRQPHLFGRGGRDRALVALAVNGPMYVRELGRVIGSDSSKTFKMVEYLLKSGLVVKRYRAGGRKYVAINKELAIYPSLMRLILALDRHWPAKRVELPKYRWGLRRDNGRLNSDRLAHMFNSPIRSQSLLFVAAVGITDMTTMIDLLGLDTGSARYAINHWEREGVIKCQTRSRHRLVQLDPAFPVANELRALLRAAIIESDELRSLRTLARKRMTLILDRVTPLV